MKAVIPCAKKKDSLWPFIESKPTGLMPVAGKPLVKHLIHSLQESGIDDIYLVTNHCEDQFKQMFDGFTNVNTVSQEELDGSGGAVEKCSFIEEDFIVVNGDVVVSGEDIQQLIDKHREKQPGATILAASEENPEKFGVLSIENDYVTGLEEKPEEPENALVNTGIYVFTPEIFDILGRMEGEKEMTDAVKNLLEHQNARFEFVDNYWLDIGSLKKLWKADELVREHEIQETEIHEDAEVDENAEITGEAEVKKEAEIKPGAVIEGKTVIGEGAIVGPNTTVRDSTVGAYSQIRSADIDNSLLFEKNLIDPSSFVEDSVIAEEADIKSNSVIRESFIGPRSFVEMNNSIRGVKFVPDARTDLSEISK